MKRQRLNEYIKNIRKIQWFICAVPLGGWLLPGHWKYLFPTVGTDEASFLCLTLTMLLAGVGAILPWAIDMGTAKLSMLLACVLVFIFSVIALFYLNEKYVISVPIHNHEYLTVSIGSERSQKAIEECPQCTDMDLLMKAGPYEDKVQEYWTQLSILTVRCEMFISYAAILFLLNFIVGIVARHGQHA